MSESRSAPQYYVRIFKEGVQKAERVGVDVDAKILSLTFEDAEKSHKLKLTVDNFNLQHFNVPIFAQGNILEFSYGYPGNMSRPQEAVVTKVTGGTLLTVEALGKEYLMNKVLNTRRFEHMSRSQIAQQIADENGYGPAEQDIEDTGQVLTWTLQSRQTNFQLLREMANKEGYEVYADATGFHFHKRRLEQKPKRTFTYYVSGTGDLMEYPKIEIDITAKPGAVKAVGRDPLKKKDIAETADNTSTKGRPALAPVIQMVDVETAQLSLQTRTATESTVATTATTAADAKKQAAGAYSKTQMSAVKFKVPAVGDPQTTAKTIATFGGLGKLLDGNYFITKVTHKLGSSYTMDLECLRDGTNGAGGAAAAPKSLGAKNDKAVDPHAGLVAIEVVDEETAQTRVEWRKK